MYTGSISQTTSDDRLKVNETFIDDSSCLLKLRPQLYDKMKSLGGSTYDTTRESGLIAQEIWYDCPELRHLVIVGSGGNPDENIPSSDDPTIDPDYSSWGPNPATVNYNGFIAYLIHAFQKQQEEISYLKELLNK
jgi:hypothetical protein